MPLHPPPPDQDDVSVCVGVQFLGGALLAAAQGLPFRGGGVGGGGWVGGGSTECYTFRAFLIARITCVFPCLCAQGSSIAEYLDFSRIAVKETLACLCACTPCEGSHAQVTSQRGSGAPGNTRCASHL